MEDRVSRLEEENRNLREIVERLQLLVEGRNKSAPTKRNMTDADAERVLIGDLAKIDHKEAAAVIGLTYAQVYSCRMQFTFKHVHKKLKDEGKKVEWGR